MRNEFTRTTNQLKMNNTKIQNEIKRMLARNEPRVLTQNVERNLKFFFRRILELLQEVCQETQIIWPNIRN